MKMQPIPYSRAVTFGRFNIGHSGHVELIKMMLDYADRAIVYVSSGAANNNWDLRVLLLSHLCRVAGLDMKRVEFVEARNPHRAVYETVSYAPFNEAVIVLGSDQQEMARKLGEEYDCPWIINRRSNSSTQMRFFLDADDENALASDRDALRLYANDEYSVRLAHILRREEKDRESRCVKAEIKRFAGENSQPQHFPARALG